MPSEALPYLTILGMALVTYATRVGGIWLMSVVPPTPRLRAWLQRLPGAILAALVAPGIPAAGPTGLLAAAVTVLVAVRTTSTVLAMIAGVGVVFLSHQL